MKRKQIDRANLIHGLNTMRKEIFKGNYYSSGNDEKPEYKVYEKQFNKLLANFNEDIIILLLRNISTVISSNNKKLRISRIILYNRRKIMY